MLAPFHFFGLDGSIIKHKKLRNLRTVQILEMWGASRKVVFLFLCYGLTARRLLKGVTFYVQAITYKEREEETTFPQFCVLPV
jgi:hypothetical protein